MSKFTFDKKEPKLLRIDIDGKIFHFNPYTLNVQKASEKFVKCQEPFIKTIKKEPTQEELEKLVLKSCTLVRETVNQIVGKGTYEKIFAGRTVDFIEHQNLMKFLFDEISLFCKENPNSVNAPSNK